MTSILDLKEKFGSPGRGRGPKRPLQDEGIRDTDGLVKRQKPQVSFSYIYLFACLVYAPVIFFINVFF